MSNIFENQETLGLFLFLFIPGFVSLKVHDLLIPGKPRIPSGAIQDAIAYGAINLGVSFWIVDAILSADLPRYLWYLCWFSVLVVLPTTWPLIAMWIRRRQLIRRFVHDPQPEVWDCIFRQRKCYWVIAHLKDRRIGGVMADKSFASSAPSNIEIYLEEVWRLDDDGNFVDKVPRSAGVFIPGDEIVALEFFEYNGEHEQ